MIFLEPAIAAKPIAHKIKNQIVKMSIEPATVFITADISEGRNQARLVGTIPADWVAEGKTAGKARRSRVHQA